MKQARRTHVLLIVLAALASMTLAQPAWEFLSGTASSKIRHLEIGIPDSHYVAAVGDFNSDRFDDFFVVSQDQRSCTVYLFDSNSKPTKFMRSNATIGLGEGRILNVVPSDYNRDGKLDVLLTIENAKGHFDNIIYFGTYQAFLPAAQTLPMSYSEVSILDFNGTLHADVFGMFESNNAYVPLVYSPTTSVFSSLIWPKGKKPCISLGRHPSVAFVDVNGDSMADLAFVCEGYEDEPQRGQFILEIFTNGEAGLVYEKSVPLSPKPSSPLSFSDIDGDGSMDIVYASNSALHILYNTQRPYCISGKEEDGCKGRDNLFQIDKSFGYNPDVLGTHRLDMPFEALFGNVGIRLSNKDPLGGPIPLRFGDFDLDGYPDLIVIDSNGHIRLLNNSICSHDEKTSPCSAAHAKARRRYFKLDQPVTNILAEVWKTLSPVKTPWSASFIDLVHNGMTGLLVNARDVSNGQYSVVSFLSTYYQDAFFFGLITTNGICHSDCRQGERFPKPKPYGVSYPGPCYKYSLVDMNGHRRVRQACQYGQTGHLSLSLPGLFLGLGRINTFVEALAIRTPIRAADNQSYHNNIIPNSNLIAFPPSDSSAESGWLIELHINPSDYILWISVSLASSMVLLASIVFIFRRMEKREDAKEKRKILHAINFDAL